jgi:TonB family protein
MEREGTVAVTFTLNTDGTINNLIVARSSGTNSLDEAALAAVMDAVPFAQVGRYIQSPQTYTLDIVFQLA